MATKSDNTFDGSMSTDAEFRAIAQFIHDVLALGWTQTSDTGQINLTTVAKPGSGVTSAGYEVWRMADTLQATNPVFLKIEYGTGASAAGFAVWLTLGTGSDGAGTITGTVQTRQIVQSVSSAATVGNSYGAAGAAWVTCCVLSTVSNAAFWFSIERTKDSAGADTGTGLILAYGSAGTNHKSQYLPFSGSVPPAETGIQCIVSTNNPSTFNSDTGIGVMIPMAGVAQQPGLGVAVSMSSDFSNGALVSFTIYGATHSYQRMDSVSTLRASGSTSVDTNTRLLLRYE